MEIKITGDDAHEITVTVTCHTRKATVSIRRRRSGWTLMDEAAESREFGNGRTTTAKAIAFAIGVAENIANRKHQRTMAASLA